MKGIVILVTCLYLFFGCVVSAVAEKTAYDYFEEALALMETGKIYEAEKSFAEAVKLDPKHIYYRYAWAISLSATKDKNKRKAAIEQFKKVVEEAPDLQQAWYYLRIVWLETEQKEDAKKYFSRMVKKHSSFPAVRLNYAYILYDLNDIRQAEKEVNEALKLRPTFSEAYCLLGKIYEKKGDIDKAIELFTKAINIDSDYAEAYFNLGVLLRKKQQYEQAEKNFLIAKNLKPSLKELIELASIGPTRGITLRGAGIVETVTLLTIYFPGGVAKVIGEIESIKEKREKAFLEHTKKKLPKVFQMEIPFDTEKQVFDFRTTPNFYLKFTHSKEPLPGKTNLVIRKIPDINLRFDPEGVIIENTEVMEGYTKKLTENYIMEVAKILPEEEKITVLIKSK